MSSYMRKARRRFITMSSLRNWTLVLCFWAWVTSLWMLSTQGEWTGGDMGATVAAIGEYFAGGSAVAAGAAGAAEIAAGGTLAAPVFMGASEAAAAGFGASAAGYGAGAWSSALGAFTGASETAAAAMGLGGASTLASKFLTSAAQAGGTAAATSLLAPRPKTPTTAPLTPMPDPAAQAEAQRRAMLEQTARRGRAATILTNPSPAGGSLGG